ncbi:epithelial membrane protein 1-like [Ptychodera flava]|uniref:epithelial membrane protein 1-like n=1 Tax=Ptychodera flava TaxID=63121 RepID=UPI003969DD87
MSLVGPISSVVVAGIAVLFYIVSTATNYWVVISARGAKTYYGLWESCCENVYGVSVCATLPDSILKGYMEAARGLMLTALIVAGIIWILAFVALIGKGTGRAQHSIFKYFTKRFWTINGMIFCVTGLLVLIGTSVYAGETNKDLSGGVDYSFGYSIILGWISIPFGVVAGAMLIYFFPAMRDDAYDNM